MPHDEQPPDPKPRASAEPARPFDLNALSDTLYEQLRLQGAGIMKHERADHTLTPTALVHEAVVRLMQSDQRTFVNRAHLLGAASIAMRRVVIDHARARARGIRGGDRARVSWENVLQNISTQEDAGLLLDLEDALNTIAAEPIDTAERNARLASFKLFGAMTNDEIAAVLDVSLSTVEKDWKYVKARLQILLHQGR
jgi:RNA polymerase sigma factor (TIGR02999 family)